MTNPSSPQAKEMADESMVRNLAAQAEAIWPQEAPIFQRHPPQGRILDIGCGTGEISARLLQTFPQTTLIGVDLEEPHLESAREKAKPFGDRAHFEKDDALHLHEPDDHFDLVVSRHVLQALPDAPKAIAEMRRVLKAGGRLHAIAEDYGMLWCHPTQLDADGFWQRIPPLYGKSIGVDLHIGRKMFTVLTDLKFADIQVDYVVLDTLRVPRDTFARIWEAWRDGYTDTIVEHSKITRAEIKKRWQEMIDCVRDPRGYALWQVPVWTARKP
ncbi:MAG TPA: class I SAM-dependent methyltransferase [Myxococcales bacterium]|nr:class I SAM-dependent methyltransferase [Myxococcales bacterium]